MRQETPVRLPASEALMERARHVIPGGVNSPVRAFGAVGGTPPFISSARGTRLHDADGREYLDYVGSWGPMILGHAHPVVIAAVREAASEGLSFGAPTEREVELAELVVSRMPGMDMVRLVNSGTEATMSALRLARAHTGRSRFIKFEGCYHGHGDAFLIQAGSGAVTMGVPNSPGIPEAVIADTLLAGYNDINRVEQLFRDHGDSIAAVIMEPVAANMGLVMPRAGFLKRLRELCTAHGTVLIVDEVMTGFRLAPGGAQERLKIEADLTTMGKIIGGGLPIGAYGGKREIMEKVAPSGPMYQAGTLSGNPVAVAAGLATLKLLAEPGTYERLDALGERMGLGMKAVIEKHGWPLTFPRIGSMFCLYFRRELVDNFADARSCDTAAFGRFFHGMLSRGIYLAPSQFEAGFISLAHTEEDIDRTLAAGEEALQEAFAGR